jgi:hypothetical protein
MEAPTEKSNSLPKLFCLNCSCLISSDDLGAVVLEGKAGALCGADVDKLIANIYVAPRDSETRSAPRVKVYEPPGTFL